MKKPDSYINRFAINNYEVDGAICCKLRNPDRIKLFTKMNTTYYRFGYYQDFYIGIVFSALYVYVDPFYWSDFEKMIEGLGITPDWIE